MASNTERLPLPTRLWIYQAERFPLVRHGLLIAAFASSAVCVSALLCGEREFPGPVTFGVAFVVLLGFFLQLRIADEFKDAELDARYRPERPVPRGLVSLHLLRTIGILTLIGQAFLVLMFSPGLLLLLGMVLAYGLLMSMEFFVPQWLCRRPLTYMSSHMLIMPLIDLFATACQWWPASGPPPGLPWFLALSYCNGTIIEVGRKTWAPGTERAGVDSYSSAWGLRRALATWLGAVASAWVLVIIVAVRIDFAVPVGLTLGLMALVMVRTAAQMANRPTPMVAKRLESLSGLWVFANYLMLGLIPMVLR
jgi:4-hydroxybenzoate polyprenyltransferase